MGKSIFAIVAVVAGASHVCAGPPPAEMVKKLTDTIRKHCPDATIDVTKEEFVAKFGTMMFTVHSRSKTGEVFPQTHQQEGPNYKGFMLRVALQDGKYSGAAVAPQTLQGPYYPTYIDAAPVEKTDKHYMVHFAFGSRLDPDLKKAIFDVIPQTQFPPGKGPR